jgi:hypothetical protein
VFGTKPLKKRIEELEIKLAKSQEYITDVLTFQAGEKALAASASPNLYDTREKLIEELVKKYKGYARFGNQLIQRIVDTRAALVMAGGLKAVAQDRRGYARELALIQDMIHLNELDGQFGQSLAVEKELEGHLLLFLEWDAEAENVRLRFLSWNDTRYEVDYDDELYSRILRIRYRRPGDRQELVIPAERAVLIKFNARIHSREGIPTLSGLLVEAEDIDKALRDWRQINRYFASPTPYFRTENFDEAKELYDRLLSPSVNWKIGKVFAGPAEFSLKGMDNAGVESIRLEIETKIKVLAGGSGVPVQFLGFPEFMSNRATAENTMEPVALVSIAEQRSWIGGFQELFDKVIELRNLQAEAGASLLRRGGVEPKMKFTTQAQVDRLSSLYLPLWEKGAISLKTLLGLLPDIDPEAEAIAVDSKQ